MHPELAQLDKNIAEVQQLALRQLGLVQRMLDQGVDATKAKAVLRGLEQVLDYFLAQRERILTILVRQ